MNNEIKEVLDISIGDDREAYIDYIDKDGKRKNYEYIEAEDLLDYITNLQEENKSLHTRIKTIKRRRKEQTAKIRKYREEITNKQNSNKDYKQRINKAIELLNDWNYLDKIDCYCEPKEVIDILQGKSDE